MVPTEYRRFFRVSVRIRVASLRDSNGQNTDCDRFHIRPQLRKALRIEPGLGNGPGGGGLTRRSPTLGGLTLPPSLSPRTQATPFQLTLTDYNTSLSNASKDWPQFYFPFYSCPPPQVVSPPSPPRLEKRARYASASFRLMISLTANSAAFVSLIPNFSPHTRLTLPRRQTQE